MSKINKNNEINFEGLSFVERIPVVDPADIADFDSTTAAEENFRHRSIERLVDQAVWLSVIAILLLVWSLMPAVNSVFRNLDKGWLVLSCFKPSIIPSAVYILSILAIYRALRVTATEPTLPASIGKSYKTRLWGIAGLSTLGILPAVIWCVFVAVVIILFCWKYLITAYWPMISNI